MPALIMIKLPKPRDCTWCFREFQPGPRAVAKKVCENYERNAKGDLELTSTSKLCQQIQKEYTRRIKKFHKAQHTDRKKNGVKAGKYNRRNGVKVKKYRCTYIENGVQCWTWSVNRFYCPGHHSAISDSCCYDGV